MTSESNWKPADKIPRGIGPVLLRFGAGASDGVTIGYQDPDTGRWLDQENREVRPAYFSMIPPFDCEDDQQ